MLTKYAMAVLEPAAANFMVCVCVPRVFQYKPKERPHAIEVCHGCAAAVLCTGVSLGRDLVHSSVLFFLSPL